MQVTDPAISSELRTLSQYEIAGLRRGATYGDDSAALLHRMAYETGHLVPQNCVKAGSGLLRRPVKAMPLPSTTSACAIGR
jgi:hypothetical protein